MDPQNVENLILVSIDIRCADGSGDSMRAMLKKTLGPATDDDNQWVGKNKKVECITNGILLEYIDYNNRIAFPALNAAQEKEGKVKAAGRSFDALK